jgi:tripartite ATP-independent transporter DctM subunit
MGGGIDITLLVVLLGSMVILLAMGLEIGWALAIMATIGLVFFFQHPVDQLAFTSWFSLNSFAMIAAPLFIFMGAILNNCKISKYLWDAVEQWLGFLPGGLAVSVIGGNAIFGAMCGSSVAATCTFGEIAFPAMEERGYDPGLALSSIGIGATLSPLIPPSILMILYGVWQTVPVVALFAAGIIPGLILVVLFMVTIGIRVKLNPSLVPPLPRYNWRGRLIAARNALPILGLIGIVLGVIFVGIMTPTEASAVAAALSIVLALSYREFSMARLKASLADAVRVTSFVMFIMAMATVVAHLLNLAGITNGFKELVLGLPIGKYGILVLFFLMYLIMGMFFEDWSMLFITFPLVMPVIIHLGFDPVWWGVMYVLAAEQSMITPPFGLGLFILKSLAPQHSIGTIVRAVLPLLIPIYITIAILVIWPQVALWLPGILLGY